MKLLSKLGGVKLRMLFTQNQVNTETAWARAGPLLRLQGGPGNRAMATCAANGQEAAPRRC